MKKTDYSWIWIGALSGLTFGVVSSFYSQWQMDEFNRTQKEKYQQRYKNGLQEFEAKEPQRGARSGPSPNKTEERTQT